MKVVFVRGFSGSGKTTVLATLTRLLSAEGKRVGTIKHIHDENFSIDTEGKDSWVHAQSGASVVVIVAPRELSIIKKGDTATRSLSETLKVFEGERIDYVLVEGIHSGIGEVKGAKVIICASTLGDAEGLVRTSIQKPICVTGRVSDKTKRRAVRGIPVLGILSEDAKIRKLIG